jgi:hypothetical protein
VPVVIPVPDLPALPDELLPPLPLPPAAPFPSPLLEQPPRVMSRPKAHASWKVFPMAIDNRPLITNYQAQRDSRAVKHLPSRALHS